MNYQYRKADKGLYGPVTMKKELCLLGVYPCTYAGRKVCDCQEYKNHIASLPRVASVPSCEWKDGEIVEEGKDFKFEEQHWTGSAWWPNYHLVDGKVKPGTKTRMIAVRISGGEVTQLSDEAFNSPGNQNRDSAIIGYKKVGGEVKEEETKLPERLKQLDSLNKAQPVPTGESEIDYKKELEYAMAECKRLADVAEYWQKKYLDQNPGWQPAKLDNL